MADGHGSLDDPDAALDSHEELRSAWNHFRSGEVVACPLDLAPLALAVDAAAGIYRFVCTQCGAATVWFESGPSGVRVPGHPPGHGSPDS